MTRKIWTVLSILTILVATSTSARAAEICGNGIDDDDPKNGLADDGCYPSRQTGVCESPLSCFETGWVGWKTGSLRYDLPPDVAPKSPWGPQIGFRRIYTSQYAPPSTPSSFNRTPLGPRWQHNYMSWIDRLPNNDAVVHTLQGEDVLVNGQTMRPQRGHHFFISYPDEYLDAYQVTTLDGEWMIYNALGQLMSITDRFNNTIRFTWKDTSNGSALDTVTDATTKRRLSFSYDDTTGLLKSVELQFFMGGAWTTFHTTKYDYVGSALASVTMVVRDEQGNEVSQRAQNNVYTNGYLTQINDADGRRIVAFKFAPDRAGEADLIETAQGTVGFDFGFTRPTCQAPNQDESITVLYFNKASANSCSSDAQCGSGAFCGGAKGGTTGACFRGARCLTVDSSSGQSLVTKVQAIGPGVEPCTGACAEVSQYKWDPSTLDLGAVKDANTSASYTTTEYDLYGLPTKIVYADTDADPTNVGGQQTVYLSYQFQGSGRVLTRVLRPSAMDGGQNCTSEHDSRCARTLYSYFANGALQSVTRTGYTLSAGGSVVPITPSPQTRYTYDAVGRVASIDGPLAGTYDMTEFTYNDTTDDPTQKGFLATRVTHGTIPNLGFPVSDQVYRYDFWGNPIEWLDVNGQRSCSTYDLVRNYLTENSVEMLGELGRCDEPAAADLIESYTRDSALRLTSVTRPDGSSTFFEYDGSGRLARTLRRDDGNRASPGDRAEYTYDFDGLLTARTTYDAAGTVKHKALASYYDSRRLQGAPNPVDTSKVATLDYDERGVVTAINGEQGLGRTEYDVDANYRLRSVSRINAPGVRDKWELDYDRLGQRTTVKDPHPDSDPNPKTLITTYDDFGRPVRQVYPDQTSMNVDRTFTALSQVESETSVMETRRFTYDPLGRLLTADYPGQCPGTSQPEAEYAYDGFLQDWLCPRAQGCSNLKGRLAYSRITLMCDGGDGTLERETFYSYDPAGRLVGEYIRDYTDETSHATDQTYVWSKGGALAQVTLPSGTALGWNYGGATSNSDTDRVTAVWRTTPATPIIENVQWNPFGPLKQYDRKDKIVGSPLRMRIERNLAYRIRSIALEGQTLGGPYYSVTLSEDAKGRVTKRDYFPNDPAGVFDSYFLYDSQDRLLCETTASVTTCPTSGPTVKNNHIAGFTGAGDRKTLLHPLPSSSSPLSNVFTLAAGTHRVQSVDQADGATPLATTAYAYDMFGRRTDEEQPGQTIPNARRTYKYDGRGNLIEVRGRTFVGGQWHPYFMKSAFDARNRRVFKAFLDEATRKQQHWFFYYDAYDRLTEVRHIPDVPPPTTPPPPPPPYTTYQLIWLEDLLVAYWQTDAPSGTASKRYTAFDETGRPVRMHSWETGDSRLVWAINPDAWGMDTVVLGSGVYQPIGFAGQYIDAETASYLDNGTRNRPGLVLNGFRTYDPFTGSYLQLDPMVEQSWNAYGYADGNPVGRSDPSGLLTSEQKARCSAVSHRGGEDGPINTEGVYAPHYWGCLPSPVPASSTLYGGRDGGTVGGTLGGREKPPKPPKPEKPAKPQPEDDEPGADDPDSCEAQFAAANTPPPPPLPKDGLEAVVYGWKKATKHFRRQLGAKEGKERYDGLFDHIRGLGEYGDCVMARFNKSHLMERLFGGQRSVFDDWR